MYSNLTQVAEVQEVQKDSILVCSETPFGSSFPHELWMDTSKPNAANSEPRPQLISSSIRHPPPPHLLRLWFVRYLLRVSSRSIAWRDTFLYLRSKSRCPACVIRRPPFSSSCSRTPIFSRACMTLRSTEPLASVWWDGREPRLRVDPWTFRRRPTPTVLRR